MNNAIIIGGILFGLSVSHGLGVMGVGGDIVATSLSSAGLNGELPRILSKGLLGLLVAGTTGFFTWGYLNDRYGRPVSLKRDIDLNEKTAK